MTTADSVTQTEVACDKVCNFLLALGFSIWLIWLLQVLRWVLVALKAPSARIVQNFWTLGHIESPEYQHPRALDTNLLKMRKEWKRTQEYSQFMSILSKHMILSSYHSHLIISHRVINHSPTSTFPGLVPICAYKNERALAEKTASNARAEKVSGCWLYWLYLFQTSERSWKKHDLSCSALLRTKAIHITTNLRRPSKLPAEQCVLRPLQWSHLSGKV